MASQMLYDRSHVIAMPEKFIIYRCVQLALGVILFGFGIFGAIFAPFSGILLTLVTAIVTITTAGYTIGSERSPHAKAYNYWAIMALEIFLVIFWLVSFALVATVVGLVAYTYYGNGDLGYYDSQDTDDYYDYDSSYTGVKRAIVGTAGRLAKRDRYRSGADAAIGIFGAAAGLGAVEFVLYVASLILLSMRIHRHRKNGGRSQPGKSLPTTNTSYPSNQIPPHQAGMEVVGSGPIMTGAPGYSQNNNQQLYYSEDKESVPMETMSPVSNTPVSALSPHQSGAVPAQPQTYQQQGPQGHGVYQ